MDKSVYNKKHRIKYLKDRSYQVLLFQFISAFIVLILTLKILFTNYQLNENLYYDILYLLTSLIVILGINLYFLIQSTSAKWTFGHVFVTAIAKSILSNLSRSRVHLRSVQHPNRFSTTKGINYNNKLLDSQLHLSLTFPFFCFSQMEFYVQKKTKEKSLTPN